MKKKASLNIIIFIAITMVAVVTLLSFWFACNQKFFSMITERVLEDYVQTTVAVKKNVEKLISYTEDFSKYISLDERVQHLMKEQGSVPEEDRIRNEVQMRKQWEDISVRLIYSTTQLAGFGVYSDKDLLYSFINSTAFYEADIIKDEDLYKAKVEKSPVWTDLMLLKSTYGWYHKEEHVFSVLKYVQGNQGEHLGTIVLFVKESSFFDTLANTDDIQNRQFYLVNANDQIVSAENKDYLNQDAAAILGITREQYLTCLEDEQLLLDDESGVPVLYVSSDIKGTEFRLVGRTVLEELQTQRKDFTVFMQITLLLAMVVAVLVSWIVAKQVTKPIHQIISVMKQIEDGDGKEKLRCPLGGTEETYQLGCEFNRLMDKVDESAHQIYLEQRQRRYNEVRLLQAQIVPHFLYNTLGMISAFIKLRRHTEAQEAIQNLANFYRMSLSRGNERITLREEVELTRNYLALQKMRYIEYVDYVVVHDERTNSYITPKLLIQPLVENVLTHGLKADGQKCVIVIETNYDEASNSCVILVSDTGCGMTPERLAQVREGLKKGSSMTNSVGLLNVYQRMKLVYGDRFTMEVDSEEGKFATFTMRIQGSPDVRIEGDSHV